MKMINKLRNSIFARDTRGLTTVEYVIILCVVAVMAIGTWQAFGARVMSKVSEAGEQIENLSTSTP
jgi:Flp pilus assembly pilin Flp